MTFGGPLHPKTFNVYPGLAVQPHSPQGLLQSLTACMAEGLLDLQIQKPGDVTIVPLPGEAASASPMIWVCGEPYAAAQGLL